MIPPWLLYKGTPSLLSRRGGWNAPQSYLPHAQACRAHDLGAPLTVRTHTQHLHTVLSGAWRWGWGTGCHTDCDTRPSPPLSSRASPSEDPRSPVLRSLSSRADRPDRGHGKQGHGHDGNDGTGRRRKLGELGGVRQRRRAMKSPAGWGQGGREGTAVAEKGQAHGWGFLASAAHRPRSPRAFSALGPVRKLPGLLPFS